MGMESEKLPEVVSKGLLKVQGLEVEVFVLDNGQRVFTKEGFEKCMQFLFQEK